MALVTFYELSQTVEVVEGTTLLEAARMAGVFIESPCSGAGTCGKCAIQVDPASLANIAQGGKHRLPPEVESSGLVLSCEALVNGDVAVGGLPATRNSENLQILKAGVRVEVPLDPFIRKEYDPSSQVTLIRGGSDELAIEAGDTSTALYGVVVDIGTTTLAAALVDLTTGTEVAALGSLNPQALHAQDVLSRIRLASTEEGLQQMHGLLIDEVGHLITRLAQEGSVEPRLVYEIVFSGNTCMLHLGARHSPASLGKYPYHCTLAGNEYRLAHRFSLPVAPSALIYLPPVISAYVGADIVCGILATGQDNDTGITLLVDIGTNGEMVLGCRGKLFATSTAAGPAFEGMNISCGMRASQGAIEEVKIGEDGTVAVKTIGDAEAVGICGSGLMDVVAELFCSGVVGASGRFNRAEMLPQRLKERMVTTEGRNCFQLADQVFISQKDIRQVQLAKGAIRSGIELLLRTVGVSASEVDRVYIAGSFGYHLRAESLLAIGLLPPQFAGKIEFVGNTSKTGGEALLLNKGKRDEIARVVQGIEVVELANDPDFNRCFVDCLNF